MTSGVAENFAPAKLSLPVDVELDYRSPEFVNPFADRGHDEPTLGRIARQLIRKTTIGHFVLCAVLAARSEAIQETVRHGGRTAVFTEFCDQIGLTYDQGKHWIRVYHFIPPPFWHRFKELEWEQVLAIVGRTHIKGETLEDRRSRVIELCEAAVQELDTARISRRRAEEVTRALKAERGLAVKASLLDQGVDSTAEPERTDVPAECLPPERDRHERTGLVGTPAARGPFADEPAVREGTRQPADMAQLSRDLEVLRSTLAEEQQARRALELELKQMKRQLPDPEVWGAALGDAIFRTPDLGTRQDCRAFGVAWFRQQQLGGAA
jgi:hypothetical protein